jgi:hypothetical protein
LTQLSDDEKVDIRRYCGYPAAGNTAAGFSSWRFYQAYGLLEYRMNNLSDSEIAVVRKYLTSLTSLEAAIPTASENLDTSAASIWSHNSNEVRDRDRLYDGWRSRLCAFFGLPPGPGLRRGSPSLIV